MDFIVIAVALVPMSVAIMILGTLGTNGIKNNNDNRY